jgi:hypothetical protein
MRGNRKKKQHTATTAIATTFHSDEYKNAGYYQYQKEEKNRGLDAYPACNTRELAKLEFKILVLVEPP